MGKLQKSNWGFGVSTMFMIITTFAEIPETIKHYIVGAAVVGFLFCSFMWVKIHLEERRATKKLKENSAEIKSASKEGRWLAVMNHFLSDINTSPHTPLRTLQIAGVSELKTEEEIIHLYNQLSSRGYHPFERLTSIPKSKWPEFFRQVAQRKADLDNDKGVLGAVVATMAKN